MRPAGFDEAVVAELPMLRAYARSLVKDPVRAEDYVQDATCRALANADKFEPGTNLSAWLVTILRNQFYSDARKRGREVEDADGTIAALVSVPGGQFDVIALKDTRRRIRLLSPEYRRALLLIAAGISYEDAAVELGCRVGTVKSRVNRARAILAGEVDEASAEAEEEAPPPTAKHRDQEISALYRAGRTASEIVKETGAAVADVMRVILNSRARAA